MAKQMATCEVVGEKHLVRSKSGLRFVARNETDRSPFLIAEPPWMPDNQSSTCKKCNAKFDFLNRRHHCRRCGNIYCHSCCASKVPLPRMAFVDPVRLCEECANTTKKENDFFDKHVKTLTNGGHFLVRSSKLKNDEIEESFLCKLSVNHRLVNFDGSATAQHDPVELVSVNSVQILTSGTDPQGNSVPSGIAIQYADSCGEIQNIKLLAAAIPNRKQSMLWVSAMQKAFKLIYETRKS